MCGDVFMSAVGFSCGELAKTRHLELQMCTHDSDARRNRACIEIYFVLHVINLKGLISFFFTSCSFYLFEK